MVVLYDLVLVCHVLGLAALIGGYLVAATGRGRGAADAGGARPNPVMVWGARVQVLTGVVMVGLAEAALDYDVNQAKIGIKLVVALAVAALTEIAAGRQRRGTGAPPGLVHGAGGLAVVNVLVAVLW